MSDQFQPDYPNWVTQIFRTKISCSRCRRRLRLADLTGLGVSCEYLSQKDEARPRGRAFVDCPRCEQQHAFEVEARRDDITEAVAEFYEHIDLFGHADDDDDEVGKPFVPSPNFPGLFKNPNIGLWSVEDKIQGDDDGDPIDAPGSDPPDDSSEEVPPPTLMRFGFMPWEEGKPENEPNAKRRRKLKKLTQPISDREAQAFLNKLGRTSFKRSSKSYRQFMKQLGVDVDSTEGE